jgi:hypothetical protein
LNFKDNNKDGEPRRFEGDSPALKGSFNKIRDEIRAATEKEDMLDM